MVRITIFNHEHSYKNSSKISRNTEILGQLPNIKRYTPTLLCIMTKLDSNQTQLISDGEHYQVVIMYEVESDYFFCKQLEYVFE